MKKSGILGKLLVFFAVMSIKFVTFAAKYK